MLTFTIFSKVFSTTRQKVVEIFAILQNTDYLIGNFDSIRIFSL